MKTLIIGAGQVGSAIKENVERFHETLIRDVQPLDAEGIEVIHICYPDHDGFEVTTRKYIDQYKPRLTIINSSVRVGTTLKCGDDVIYSPTRGRHPNLAKEMKVFHKCIAGLNQTKVDLARAYFAACGFKVLTSSNPESLEFLKVMSNVHMGLEIAWRQEVQRMMDRFGIDSAEYDAWEVTYRQGLLEIGDHNLLRPIMRPDPIGGHCVLPCTELLREQFDSSVLDFIIHSNQKAKEDREVSQERRSQAV
jgi:hypothetical protein